MNSYNTLRKGLVIIMHFSTFGFIGLGLIGGSIAKAIKQKYTAAHIVAFDTNETMLTDALANGIADEISSEIGSAFSTCDIIFLCAPVSINNENLAKLKPFLKNDTLVTDVGSVKTPIHDTVVSLGLESQFIGGHPMAGSEKSGFGNANPLILENAYYILTPESTTSPVLLESYQELVKALGAIPLVLNCKEHDYVTAAVSHVPHLIAASLVNLVHDHDTPECVMKTIAAGGFKDITRIASSSPAMWESICMSNTEHITTLMDAYIADLQHINDALKQKQEGFTYKLFEESKEYRDSFATQSRGPIKKVFGCYVDIPDETGALAMIALILANKKISIKNIGIVHNREFEEGVLQIEFYEQASLDKAIDLLRMLQYTVYERK